jgi:myo-inositol-1-phosphate synthase
LEEAESDSPLYESLDPVFTLLSYFLKAPLVPQGEQVVNALARQRNSLVNMFRACLGLSVDPEIPLRGK